MHVLHVITTLNKGGAESHLVDLCRGLKDRGVQQTVAYLKGDSYWSAELEAMGVDVIALHARRYGDLGAFWRLVRALRSRRPDIVHAHMPPAELYAVAARWLVQGSAYMVSKHVDRHPFYPGPGSAWLERMFARPAKRILCISQAVNDYFRARWPATLARKLITVRYGLEARHDDAALRSQALTLRQEWGVAADETVFGIAARFVEQKAIDTLISAFAMLSKGAERPVRLVLVGQGPLEPALRAHADRLGISPQIVWAGFRTDIPVVMRAFDVFVLSSIFEGFGLVLLEAMEASTPIIASRVSAIPEIVLDSETGFLVEPRSPEALSSAMAKMLIPETRAALGTSGHHRLVDVFGVGKMADATLGLYRAIMAERGASVGIGQ